MQTSTSYFHKANALCMWHAEMREVCISTWSFLKSISLNHWWSRNAGHSNPTWSCCETMRLNHESCRDAKVSSYIVCRHELSGWHYPGKKRPSSSRPHGLPSMYRPDMEDSQVKSYGPNPPYCYQLGPEELICLFQFSIRITSATLRSLQTANGVEPKLSRRADAAPIRSEQKKSFAWSHHSQCESKELYLGWKIWCGV